MPIIGALASGGLAPGTPTIGTAGNFSVRCTPIFFDGTGSISTTTNIGSFDNILYTVIWIVY